MDPVDRAPHFPRHLYLVQEPTATEEGHRSAVAAAERRRRASM
jgi:hypothetical protein